MNAPPEPRAVVIGASAGAIDALSVILPALSEDYRLPIMIVVHLPPQHDSRLAQLLQSKCRLRVVEAQDKEPISAGFVYFAPPDYHLLVERDCRLSLSSEEPVHHSRPAIDVLFETAAEAYQAGLIGVILSGANWDGAAGLRKIVEEGGVALVQRPDLAYASRMPQSAIESCPEAKVLTLEEIANTLLTLGEEP